MLLAVDEISHRLQAQGYRHHEGFSHRHMVSFVRRYFFKFNPIIVAYWVAQFAALFIAVLNWSRGGYSFGFLLSFLGGMACLIFLVPVHELLHGVGYKLAGAPRVQYRVLWKQFVFYAIADRFVTRKWHFVFLALVPFVVINSILIFLIMQLSSVNAPWLCGALFMHVAGCSGDFALLSYFHTYWSKDPVTFDDAIRGESHFFIRE